VLIRQIQEAIAEEDRKEIIERLWKGRQERTRKGKAPGGNVPYGYRREGKNWVPEPQEAAAVRQVFALAATGSSSTEIAASLNADGRTRRNGGPWTPREVQGVLARKELYEEGRVRYGNAEGTDENLVLIKKKEPDS
jgi:DNA invertase Pin-like site-specific DNA recombinase